MVVRADDRHRGFDAATMLTGYLVLLLAIPAALVVGPLGTAGAPATLFALAAFLWWTWTQLHRAQSDARGPQPVRRAVLVLLLAVLAAYGNAMALPFPVEELSPADSGLLRMIAFAGLVLVASDGLGSWRRHRTLVARLVLLVGLAGVLGIVQYFTKELYVDRIVVPGLSASNADWTLAVRSGLTRPSGTAVHPIEFGVVMTMVLPLAITLAQHAPSRRGWYRLLLGAISLCVLLSISRSAIVCALVAVGVPAIWWRPATLLRAGGIVMALLVFAYLTVPGLLGTLTSLVTGASDDASIASRTNSYTVAWQFIARSPELGRGFGTFLPQYWILDNQYLGFLVETGVIGLLALLLLVFSAAYAARRAALLAQDRFDVEIARALLASVLAGAIGLAFFDTFSFPQSAGVFFLLTGLAGASLRLARAGAGPGAAESGTASDTVGSSGQRSPAHLAGAR